MKPVAHIADHPRRVAWNLQQHCIVCGHVMRSAPLFMYWERWTLKGFFAFGEVVDEKGYRINATSAYTPCGPISSAE